MFLQIKFMLHMVKHICSPKYREHMRNHPNRGAKGFTYNLFMWTTGLLFMFFLAFSAFMIIAYPLGLLTHN